MFVCDNCKKVFVGLDIEYAATAFSQPLECSKCGSMHTRPPFSSKSFYRKIWEQADKTQTF